MDFENSFSFLNDEHARSVSKSDESMSTVMKNGECNEYKTKSNDKTISIGASDSPPVCKADASYS